MEKSIFEPAPPVIIRHKSAKTSDRFKGFGLKKRTRSAKSQLKHIGDFPPAAAPR